jgi:hypothetical protein
MFFFAVLIKIRTFGLFLDIFKMSEESADELPANWQSGKTNDGRVFYIDHETQITQWEHPVTKQVKVIRKG